MSKQFIPISFSADVTIPTPTEEVKNGVDYVVWGGDNLYPQFLSRLYYDNPYQTGIINGKVLFITGSGIDLTAQNPDGLLALKQFVANNGTEFSVDEIIHSVALDLELYNGFALKGVWNRDGSLAYIEHVDFDKIRVGSDLSMFYYSDDWSSKKQNDSTGFKTYPSLNTDLKRGEFIYYCKMPNKNYPSQGSKRQKDLGVYPKPTYSGAIKDLLSDIEISNFHFYELKNGMKAGTLVTLTNGIPADEEKRAVESAYRNGLTNTESAGGVMINFVDGQEQIPDIQNLNGNDLDKRYLMTEEAIRKKIFVAHSVISPSLFGLPTQGSLGSQQEIEQAYYIFVKTYVRGRQKMIEDCLNYIINVADINGSIKLKEPESFFEKEAEEIEEVTMSDEFSSSKNFNDILIGKLAQMGRPKTKGKTVFEQEYKDGVANSEFESKLISKLSKQTYHFIDALDELHLNVLKLINDGEEFDGIKSALGVRNKKLMSIYTTLQDSGYLKKDGSASKKGLSILRTEGRKLDDFEIVYTYEKRREESGGDVIKGTRDFCRAIINLDREYKREEIDELNKFSPFAKEGLDVWNYRGGWYNKNGVNRPSCRHIWKQKVIFK